MTEAQTATTVKKKSTDSSLLPRCFKTLISKPQSPIEQEIRLSEPFRQYNPGNAIKGIVILHVAKPQRITHLTLRLHGFVKVLNKALHPGEQLEYDEELFSTGIGNERRGIEYFGNGFAQLFDEEVVLCGDGCLREKTYEFHFHMTLPLKGIPSGINVSWLLFASIHRLASDSNTISKFERGTISYLLSSTVTRETATSPRMIKHCKLNVQEIIDIASIQKPKAQTLSLDAMHKRKHLKNDQKSPISTPIDTGIVSMDEIQSQDSIRAQVQDDSPQSPAPSEISTVSQTGSSTSSDLSNSMNPSLCIVDGVTQYSSIASATTELLQGGCLAGETIPLRISIQHAKALRKVQGIVITLFRQGRIDSDPDLPLVPCRRARKMNSEDYYPRSRTGLGGLSLSSPGPSKSFRQDLSQTFAPIMVDPNTHTQIFNTSIEVPIDSFPTISGVPGDMISFKYFVEIVVDLRGKLGGQDRIRPHLSMTSTQQHACGDPRISRQEGTESVVYSAASGVNTQITDQLRRTKGVLFTKTEVIIGTKDSSRTLVRQREIIINTGSPMTSVQRAYLRAFNNYQRACNNLTNFDVVPRSIPPLEMEGDSDETTRVPMNTATLAALHPHEDKQELERQRLLGLASAPPVEASDYDPSVSQALQPSAPILFEDDIFDINDPRVPTTFEGYSTNSATVGEDSHTVQ